MTPDYGSRIVAACEKLWRGIQKTQRDLPDVVITLGEGAGKLLGSFQHSAWHSDTERTGIGHVVLAGERLKDGAEGVLETVLHEAAHALAHARGIKDTSRQGRYHNRRYADLANTLGLRVDQVDNGHGYAFTALMPETIDQYAAELQNLQQVIDLYKRPPTPAPRKPRKEPEPLAICECGRKIPQKYLPVSCGLCATEFKEEL